jgi:antitoxin MazE
MVTIVRIKKWGNSAAVRISANVLAEAGLEIDQVVELRQRRGRIIIEPIVKTDFDLKDLLDRIRDDNLHNPIDTGPPLGREAW